MINGKPDKFNVYFPEDQASKGLSSWKDSLLEYYDGVYEYELTHDDRRVTYNILHKEHQEFLYNLTACNSK